LIRFLRARKGDIQKATKMIKEDICWRKEVGADTILDTIRSSCKFFDDLNSYYPGKAHKLDKLGIPVYYERIGLVDTPGILKIVPKDDIVKYHIYFQENSEKIKFEATSNDPMKLVDLCCIGIEDLTGLGFKHLGSRAISLLKELFALDEAHYPCGVRKLYMVNSPTIVSVAWNLINPLLDEDTASKVKFLSNDFMEILTQSIDKENIPSYLGGGCNCEGGCVPSGGIFTTSLELIQVVIKDQFEEKVMIDTTSTISWKFKVEEHDIGFAVYRITEKGEKEEIIEYNRYDSTQIVTGSTKPLIGEFVLTWDNSFSYFRKKTINYKVIVDQELPNYD